ncbi:MAG: hypothetical protein E7184_03575 [Erysipelotrichaceae bacterium]|nr:hypothetical protein [Erysipelotrichaceae bacterium]
MNLLKKTFKLYQKDFTGVLSIALVWCAILFLSIALSQIIGLGPLFYIFLVIPATISLRFVYFTYSMGKPINYNSFKIGFLTLISSIKLYFRMIKEALIAALITLIAGIFMISLCISVFNNKEFTLIQEMMNNNTFTNFGQIIDLIPWIQYAIVGLIIVCVIIYFLFKFRYNFLPYIAFQSPIDAKSAKNMGEMMVKKTYIKYVLINASVVIFFIPLTIVGYYVYKLLLTNGIFTEPGSILLGIGTGCILYAPILGFYGLMNAIFYNISSIPFQTQINKALDKLLKELKSLEESNIPCDENKKDENKKDE